MNKMKKPGFWDGRVMFLSFVAVAISAAGAAEGPFKMSSLIVPKGVESRNPTTEISVGFGDVVHLSPWRVKRRFPRSVEARGGQLVALRDAMLAINELVAADDEMPAHSFAFAKDGMLAAICDIPLVRERKNGEVEEIYVRIDGGAMKSVTQALLDEPVRDFSSVAFIKAARKNADAHADGSKTVVKAVGMVHGGSSSPAATRKTGTVKVITLPGGATMEMIWCAPGSFMMGSPATEEGRFEDEPIHHVTLTKGFWLGKYEVTQTQWQSVMRENRSRFKAPDRPVDSVSWEDCQAFIRRANTTLGGMARLPTEAEWEYACRAGSGQPVAGTGHIGDMAWYDSNSGSQTHPVGKNQKNAWGFYDMHGNVLEWCADWFSHAEGAAVDPKGPTTGSFRVLRGGCWFFYARDCRSAYRLKRDPCLRNCIYGFRLACSEK